MEDELEFTYQWLRNGARIAGATTPYLDLSDDTRGARGDAISVEVVATRGKARGAPVRSAAIAVGPVVEVRYDESRSEYRVEGTDTTSIFSSIRRNAPRDQDSVDLGRAEFKLERSLVNSHPDGLCAIDVLELRDETRLILPGSLTAALTPALRTKYEAFRAAVEVHERRHLAIRKTNVDALVVALRDLAPASSCGELDRDISRAIADMRTQHDADQERFHQEDAARIKASCAGIERELASLRALMNALQSQPARYNVLVPATMRSWMTTSGV